MYKELNFRNRGDPWPNAPYDKVGQFNRHGFFILQAKYSQANFGKYLVLSWEAMNSSLTASRILDEAWVCFRGSSFAGVKTRAFQYSEEEDRVNSSPVIRYNKNDEPCALSSAFTNAASPDMK
eukprot:gb/GECG01013679.1/.p1 GENE.gb/GECG01013679.1/~~gb/GECG01013679.1/.p1  ORF type:complete len:123 (+),score=14.60 gb/GECG01013679.1/:1-369(+)